MKKLLWLLAVCLCITLPAGAFACTGFAVYGENGPIYGANMDHYDLDYYLRIDDFQDCPKVLSIYYMQNGLHAMMPVFSEDGLFTTLQMFFPEAPYTDTQREGEESIANLAMWTPYAFDRVEQVREVVRENPPQHVYGSFHSLYADASGDAMVLERMTDKMYVMDEVHMTDIEGNFILMTNFPNFLLTDTPLQTIAHIWFGGMDRYEAAYDYIAPRADTFTVADGLGALESAVSTMGDNPTVYSLVCDVDKGLAYLAIKADFDHVWEISLEEMVVRTYAGFAQSAEFAIEGEGVALRDLWDYAVADAGL